MAYMRNISKLTYIFNYTIVHIYMVYESTFPPIARAESKEVGVMSGCMIEID